MAGDRPTRQPNEPEPGNPRGDAEVSGAEGDAAGAEPVSSGGRVMARPASEVRADGAAKAHDAPDIEPMTWKLMGRLFGVPLAIIGVIVLGAIIVVVSFGSLTSTAQKPIGELLAALEQNSGEKTWGVLLLPAEKELWQAASELSARLKNKDSELTPEQLAEVTDRLMKLVQAELEPIEALSGDGQQAAKVRSSRVEHLMRALAETERPEAYDLLIRVLREGAEAHAIVAMTLLAEPLKTDESRRKAVVEGALTRLTGASEPSTKVVAATLLGVLAPKGDEAVVEALRAANRLGDADVAWAVALSLARLGSTAGRSTLRDLMDREYLSGPDRYQVRDDSGQMHRYPLPAGRIDEIMMAAMEAAWGLNDPQLNEAVQSLENDSSLVVKGKAKELIARGHAGASGD